MPFLGRIVSHNKWNHCIIFFLIATNMLLLCWLMLFFVLLLYIFLTQQKIKQHTVNMIHCHFNFLHMYKCIMISVVYKYLHFTLIKFWAPTAWHWKFCTLYSYEHLHGECHGCFILNIVSLSSFFKQKFNEIISQHADEEETTVVTSVFHILHICITKGATCPSSVSNYSTYSLWQLKPTSGSTQMSPFGDEDDN